MLDRIIRLSHTFVKAAEAERTVKPGKINILEDLPTNQINPDPQTTPFEKAPTEDIPGTNIPSVGNLPDTQTTLAPAQPGIFDLEYFRNFKNTDENEYKYLQSVLPVYSHGFSTISYDLGGDKILVFAVDTPGRADLFNQAQLSGKHPLFINVYDYGAGHQATFWIITDKTVPLNDNTFKKITKIPVETLKNVDPNKPIADQKLKIQTEEAYNLLQKIVDAAKEFPMITGGLFDPKHWGLTTDNQLKLFDLGISRLYQRVSGGKGSIGGQGSSRQVFDIGNNKVLKLAQNKAGIAQNTKEMITYRNSPMFANIFNADKNGLWIISDKITPFKNTDAFEDYTGIPASIFEDEWAIDQMEKLDDKSLIELKKQFRLSDKAASILEQMVMAVIFAELSFGDALDITHWGLNKKGHMKLYDYGLDSRLYDEFYHDSGWVKLEQLFYNILDNKFITG